MSNITIILNLYHTHTHTLTLALSIDNYVLGNVLKDFEGINSDLMFDTLANFEYLLPNSNNNQNNNSSHNNQNNQNSHRNSSHNNDTNNQLDIFDTQMQAFHNSQYVSNQNHQQNSNIMHLSNRPSGLTNIHQFQNMSSDSGGPNATMAQQRNQHNMGMHNLIHEQYSRGVARAQDDDDVDEKNGKVSKAQAVLAKEKRRERNKVLARKTRVKKKFELESLRDQAAKLHKENESLKALVQTRLPPPVSASVLMQCDIQLPENVLALVNNMIARLDCNQALLMEKMNSLQRAFCISNACAADYPIVYASPGFVELTGYPLVEIIGRNCRFLQGPDTDKKEAQRLGSVMRDGKETNATLKNYRRDCSSFWNFIQIAPMKDTEGRITLMVGVQCDVTSPATLAESTASGPYASLTESTSLHTATHLQKQVRSFVSSSIASTAGSAGHTSHDDRESREGSSNSGNEQGGNDHNSPHSFERDSQCSGSRGESRSGSANGDSGEYLIE